MCLWWKELLQCSHLLTELGSKSSDISNRRLVGKRLGDIGPLFVKTDRTFLFTFVHNIPAGVTGNIKTLTYLTDGHHTSVVQDVHVHVQCMYMCRRVSLLPFALQGLSIDNEFHLANIDSSPVHVPDGQHNTARRVKILLSQLLTRTHSIQVPTLVNMKFCQAYCLAIKVFSSLHCLSSPGLSSLSTMTGRDLCLPSLLSLCHQKHRMSYTDSLLVYKSHSHNPFPD